MYHGCMRFAQGTCSPTRQTGVRDETLHHDSRLGGRDGLGWHGLFSVFARKCTPWLLCYTSRWCALDVARAQASECCCTLYTRQGGQGHRSHRDWAALMGRPPRVNRIFAIQFVWARLHLAQSLRMVVWREGFRVSRCESVTAMRRASCILQARRIQSVECDGDDPRWLMRRAL